MLRNQTSFHHRVMNEASRPFGYSELQSFMGSITRVQGKVILGEVDSPNPRPKITNDSRPLFVLDLTHGGAPHKRRSPLQKRRY